MGCGLWVYKQPTGTTFTSQGMTGAAPSQGAQEQPWWESGDHRVYEKSRQPLHYDFWTLGPHWDPSSAGTVWANCPKCWSNTGNLRNPPKMPDKGQRTIRGFRGGVSWLAPQDQGTVWTFEVPPPKFLSEWKPMKNADCWKTIRLPIGFWYICRGKLTVKLQVGNFHTVLFWGVKSFCFCSFFQWELSSWSYFWHPFPSPQTQPQRSQDRSGREDLQYTTLWQWTLLPLGAEPKETKTLGKSVVKWPKPCLLAVDSGLDILPRYLYIYIHTSIWIINHNKPWQGFPMNQPEYSGKWSNLDWDHQLRSANPGNFCWNKNGCKMLGSFCRIFCHKIMEHVANHGVTTKWECPTHWGC